MKIDHLLLLQIFASQQAYQSRSLELLSLIRGKLEGWTPEQQQKLASEVAYQTNISAEQILETLKIDFASLFPDQSEIDDKTGEVKSLTLEEWQKRSFSKD